MNLWVRIGVHELGHGLEHPTVSELAQGFLHHRRGNTGNPDGATEIVSTGMELLNETPKSFAENDPEYFKFMVGVVHGVFQ